MTTLLTTLALQVALNNTGNGTTDLSPTLSDLGYVQFPDILHVAYKIYEELATWKEAQERCMSEGGHLAIADSPRKIARIRSIKNQSDHWLHVGIYKIASTSEWARFDNGLPVSPVPWAYDNADRAGNCAGISMFADGLVDYPCIGMREYFVCETRITGDVNRGTEFSVSDSGLISSQSTPQNHTATLPDGYVAYSDVGAAYKVVITEMTWDGARKLCFDEGAQLALIDSVEKINHVEGMIPHGHVAQVGIYRFENEWVSVRDGEIVESIPWQQGYPSRDLNCLKLNPYHGLYNGECTRYLAGAYICELPIPTS